MKIEENYNLKHFNTFGISANAKYFCEFSSVEELRFLFENAIVGNNERLILGGGSNILFTRDFDGVVLLNKIKGQVIISEDNEHAVVKAGAGENWHEFVLSTISRNLGGLENLSLIPGTVGAAPIQNIGAYGVEIKDVFQSLEAFNIATKEIEIFTHVDCCFGYRNSVFKNECKGKYIITSVSFKLKKSPEFNTSYGAIQETLSEMGINELSVKAISDAVIKIRRSKLPDPAVIGNAGSFFKNPEIPEDQFRNLKSLFPELPSYPASQGYVKVPAGWLNEMCGWKGKKIGEAGVHKDQALVLVNYGNARGEEIKNLSEAIKASVMEKFGIQLETEVNIV
jgi:UDP-N-acetylmuramate dehydrogenase